MLGVEGQYVMTISISNKTDFVKEEDLEHFTCIETAGGNLPEFQMAFTVRDPEVLGYFNEKNDLIVQYGKTKDQLTKTSWKIGFPAMSPVGDEGYKVQLKGTLSNSGYVSNPITGIYKGTSADAIGQRATAAGFSFETNTTPADTMNWIQPGISDWEFLRLY